MNHKPRKHKFVVELTDMDLGLKPRWVRSEIAEALRLGLNQTGFGAHVANVQVKEASRVMAYWKRKRTRS